MSYIQEQIKHKLKQHSFAVLMNFHFRPRGEYMERFNGIPMGIFCLVYEYNIKPEICLQPILAVRTL